MATPDTLGTFTITGTIYNCGASIPFEIPLHVTDGTEPPPGAHVCNETFGENDMSDLNYHDYGNYYLDTRGVSLMFLAWDVRGGRPNRFTLYNETDAQLVDGTGW